MSENEGVDQTLGTPGLHANGAKDSDDMTTPKSHRTTGPSPAFQFYPRDWFASRKVDNMSMTERGIYITLLARCWLEDGLPTDFKQLGRMVRMKPDQLERLWNKGTLCECFYLHGGKLHHSRLDAERRKQLENRQRQSDNGKKGGRPKKAVGSFGLSETKPTESFASAIASATAVGTERPRAIPKPISQRRRLDAAWEFGDWYVPNRAHADLRALHPPGFEPKLFAFYETTVLEWTDGARKGQNPGADMIRFWKARHDEAWPPAADKPNAGPVYQKAPRSA